MSDTPRQEPPAPLDETVSKPADSATLDPTLSRPPAADQPTLEHSESRRITDPHVPAIPGYEFLGKLGQGGMGVVFQARETALNRVVALKMILGGAHAGSSQLERFRVEAQAIARLDHPHVVRIYHVGEHNGLPFFSLEFCPGGSLAQRCQGAPQPAREAAALIEKLGRAVQAAHDQGVIHRDLKPANVLLAADGAPKITDFGLAKDLASDGPTNSGDILGTPSYVAPEQARGELREIGPATDVYALGAILYELLTGRPPFRGETVWDTIEQVIQHEPVPPRRLLPTIPADLETVCLKCLEKLPAKRYVSAAALADDVGRFLRGEPTLARPVSAVEHAWRWCRRNRLLAGSLAVVSGALLLAVVVLAISYERVVQAERGRALAQVDALLEARPAAVPQILRNLDADRAAVLPRLRELRHQPDLAESDRARVSLALLAVDPGEAHYLRDRLLAADAEELLLIRDCLKPYAGELTAELWKLAADARLPTAQRFRLAVALAAFDPDNPRWRETAAAPVASQLLDANPLHLGLWTEALRPVRQHLLTPLAAIYRDHAQREKSHLASSILADYHADQPVVLVDLLLDADDRQFQMLWPKVLAHRTRAVVLLLRELEIRAAGTARAARQAQAAVALLQLGQGDAVWPLFRHQPDPSVRSFLIHRLQPLHTDPQVLVERLEKERDVSSRRALLLSLGEFEPTSLPGGVAEKLTPRLIADYRDDPDPGIHAALDWLLRQRWSRGADLDRIDQGLKGQPARLEYRWHVSSQGQTFTIIPGPVEFLMGSPDSEPERFDNERLHRQGIDRSFAIATKKVTVEQFERFQTEMRMRQPDQIIKKHCPDVRGPLLGLTWFEAAAYCRWLSEQEGIPEDQMCYPPLTEIRDGVKLPADYLERTGYRLPSEAEWEYAARAGARTSRYYGSSAELLPYYAWYVQDSHDRTWPVGQLKPNDLGLFDALGNSSDWVGNRIAPYPQGMGGKPALDAEDLQPITDANYMIFRGGAFAGQAGFLRLAHRFSLRPLNRNLVGLRLVRTVR